MRALAQLAALLVVGGGGCATAHGRFTLANGTVVHTLRRDYSNALLVVHGDRGVLFDAGYEKNGEQLERDVREAGFDPAHLGAIVLSHGHADHAGGAGHFQRKFGTRIVVGKADAELLAAGHNDHLCPTDRSARSRVATDQAAVFTPVRADLLVAEATPLEPLAGIPGSIVPLPGHTAGSQIVILGEAILVGDLFRGAILGSSATTHFYMCDMDGNRRDIRRLLGDIAPHATIFFVGHFGPVSRGSVADLAASR